jgi:colanic acid biosynthesis glycosyl transferase WcaI
LKILFLSQYFPPEPGAPAARVSELARAWVRQGHDVTVLTGFPNHPTGVVPEAYRGSWGRHESWEGVKVHRTWIYAAPNAGTFRRSLAYGSYAASALLRALLDELRPDVLIATSPQILGAAAGMVAAKARGVPFVLEVRDLWPDSIVAVGALPEKHPVVKALRVVERSLYAAADHIVVVTESFVEELAGRGVPRSRLSVVENGVDLQRFEPAVRETALRAELGWEGDFVAVYAGTHGMAHGLDAVLDVAKAMAAEKDVKFLFVGEGAERKRLAARVADEGLANVRMLGALPRERMPEVYATADLCLVPLRKSELFTTVLPSKLFEIFGMARPVLLSVDGEARRLVERSGGGRFVPPEDVTAMVEGIRSMKQDRAATAAMGIRAREFVREHYDRERLAERYLKVLQGLLGDTQ